MQATNSTGREPGNEVDVRWTGTSINYKMNDMTRLYRLSERIRLQRRQTTKQPTLTVKTSRKKVDWATKMFWKDRNVNRLPWPVSSTVEILPGLVPQNSKIDWLTTKSINLNKDASSRMSHLLHQGTARSINYDKDDINWRFCHWNPCIAL